MSINLHAGQSRVFRDMFVERVIRFAVVCCARGWGKSFELAVAAMTAVFELLELDESVPHKYVYIIAPTYGDVTDIYYPLLCHELGVEAYCVTKPSRDIGRFTFPNKVELRLLSYEAVERMRGKGCYFAGWDEVSSCVKGIKPQTAWQSVVKPAISTRWSPMRAQQFGAKSPGRGLVIGTPKGYNFFYDMFNYQETDANWRSYQYDYETSPFIDPEEVEADRHKMTPVEFASEYLASFEESGNNVFYCFDRKTHVRDDLEDWRPGVVKDGIVVEQGEDVHAGIDFNVGIMATTLSALRGKQLHILDEVSGHPDTETLAVSLKTRFIDKGHRVIAYPDPTGKSRKSSSPVGRTDFSILREYGIQVLAREASPPLVDSANAVNRMLKTAAGEVSIYIRPRAKGTINSLQRTRWVDNKPDTATIDKSDGVEHYSDGVRYKVEYLFPVQNGRRVTKRGFNF